MIDFAAALYGLGKKEAAAQLAQDFGFPMRTGNRREKQKPKPRQKSPVEQFQEAKSRCFRTPCRLSSLADGMENGLRPALPGGSLSSPVCGSLYREAHVEYLLDVLLFGGDGGKAALITDYGKDVIQLEQRMAELAAADAARTKTP